MKYCLYPSYQRRELDLIGRSLRAGDALVMVHRGKQRDSHLISCLLDPFDHLRDGILVHALARFPNRVHDGEITLQRVERGDRGIVVASHAAIPSNVLV